MPVLARAYTDNSFSQIGRTRASADLCARALLSTAEHDTVERL